MKDLKKLKDEFEKKIKLAEIENKMEERFGCEFMALSRLRGDGIRIIARTEDMHIASELLKEYPADEKQALDASASNPKGAIFGLYKAMAVRGFADAYTKLKITWLYIGNEFQIELRIDDNEVLERFFVNDQRKMSDSECSTYKPLRRGHIVRDMDLPIKRFICDQIAYQGGYRSATEPERIQEIIDAIKEA